MKWNGAAWVTVVDQGSSVEIHDTAQVLRVEMSDTSRIAAGDTAAVLRPAIGDSARAAAGDTASALRPAMGDSARAAASDTASALRGAIGDTANVLRIEIGDTSRLATADTAAVLRAEMNALDSTNINAGGISFSDINQNAAASGEIMKWSGAAWAPAADQGSAAQIGDTANVLRSEMSDTARAAASDTAAALRLEMSDTARAAVSDTASALRSEMGDTARAAAGDTAAVLRAERGWTDDGTIVRLNSATDSVGIGTLLPTEALDVVGNIHASGTITSGSSITINGTSAVISSTTGEISFDNDDITTAGKATIGPSNVNNGANAFVAGQLNTASGPNAVVSGGKSNLAGGSFTTVAGGENNSAGESTQSHSTIGGGLKNLAKGEYGTVPGGRENSAEGVYSFAAGTLAKAKHAGALVLSAHNYLSSIDSVYSGQAEQMVLRATGKFYFTDEGGQASATNRFIDTKTGAYLTNSGNWTNSSDKNRKENFESIDRQELLEKIAELDITRWNYKVDSDSVTHIGPMAQDFYELFGVGVDDKSISTLDPSGIALAAVQALYAKSKELDELKSQLEELRVIVEAMRSGINSNER